MLAGHSIGEEGNSHGVRRRFVSHCGGDRFVGGHCGGGLCCSGRSSGDFVAVGHWIGGHCGGGPCCMYSRGRFSGDFVVVVRCNSGRGGFVRYFNVFGPSVSMLKENRLCFN